MKTIVISLLVTLAASSQASFEMMLLADNTNGVIHRYDPVNHIYLGSFGRGSIGTVTSLSLDQANSRVFVKYSNIIAAFDYNTGTQLFMGNVNASGPSVYRSNYSDFITASGTQLFRTSLFGNSFGLANIYLAGVSSTNLTSDGFTTFITLPATGQMIAVNGAVTGAITQTSGANPNLVGDTVSGMMISESGGLVFANSQTDKQYNAWNKVAANSLITGNISTLITTTAITRAHGIQGYFLGTTTTGTGLQKFYEDYSNYGTYAQVALPSSIGSINHAVTILTPEPGSMIAIAVGLATLAKRRKK